jgi:hypothetical protein
MFAFVLRLVATSPSFEYKTIKSRIFKESSHHIYQKLMQITQSHWKVLCLLSIKLNKRTLHSLQQWWSPSVLYMRIVFFLTCGSIWITTPFSKCGGLRTDNECDSATFYWGVCTKPEESEWSCMSVLCVSILSPFLRVSDCILKLSWWRCIELIFIFLGEISVGVILYYIWKTYHQVSNGFPSRFIISLLMIWS